jgi:hypothetical protein
MNNYSLASGKQNNTNNMNPGQKVDVANMTAEQMYEFYRNQEINVLENDKSGDRIQRILEVG